MPNQLGGVLHIIAGGQTLSVRGTVTVRLGLEERETVVGQSGVHGYTATPTVPGLDVEVSVPPGFDLVALHEVDNMMIQADLRDGRSYIARDAWYKAAGGGEFDAITAGMTLNFDCKSIGPV
ncbi:phage tail tube protein [Pacificispira sp.]|uniref:phage tail tube protein n=1 Tax=Pacificispira sp. TaxID=2888761 RepID=UPI003BA9AA53